MNSSKVCAKCGYIIRNINAKFCGRCGAVINHHKNLSEPLIWWERFCHQPLVFYPTIIISILVTILTLYVGVIDVINGFPQAWDHLSDWCLTSTITPERQDETLILIAPFYRVGGEDSADTQREIEDAVLREVNTSNFSSIRIELVKNALRYDDRINAEKVASCHNASIIIWGDISDTRVHVSFLNLRQTNHEPDLSVMDLNSLIYPAIPDAYARFVLEEIRPRATFLALFTVAEALRINKSYEQSVNVMEKAIEVADAAKRTEGLAEAYLRLGWLYQYAVPMRDTAKAENFYNEAIIIGHKSETLAASYNNRGNIFADNGKTIEAIKDYEKAISYISDSPLFYSNRGTCYFDMGNLNQSIVDYNKAIEVNANFSIAYFNRGNTRMAQGEYNQAIKDYSSAIDLEKLPEFYTNRGIAHYLLEDPSEAMLAVNDFTEAIILNQSIPQPYYNRALTYRYLGQIEFAIMDLERALLHTKDERYIKIIQDKLQELRKQ